MFLCKISSSVPKLLPHILQTPKIKFSSISPFFGQNAKLHPNQYFPSTAMMASRLISNHCCIKSGLCPPTTVNNPLIGVLPCLKIPRRPLVFYSKKGKLKTNKAVLARFRLTGAGRVKRWRCRTARNRKRRGMVIMEEGWRAQKIRIMMGKPKFKINSVRRWVD